MEPFPIVVIPVFVAVAWLYVAYIAGRFPNLTSKRILLLIAHPDDEAMFFAPTVQGLIRPELGNRLKILCLSSGNASGLGEVRKKELMKSATILGLEPTDVIIVEDANLQDGLTPWSPQYISRILLSNLAPTLSKTPNTKPPTTLVDTIITFDEGGVSGHPNHTSCCRGALSFLSDLMRGREGWESPVAVYTLKSVGIVRKYATFCDCLITLAVCVYRVFRQGGGAKTKNRSRDGRASDQSLAVGSSPTPLLFISSFVPWNRGQRAMAFGHRSQMVWFRWGWIALGRYLAVNDLVKMKAV